MTIQSTPETTPARTPSNGDDRTPDPAKSAVLSRRAVLAALRRLRRGDFSVRLRDDLTGLEGQICEVFNDVAQQAATLEEEFKALRRAIGRQGRTRQRVRHTGATGGWARYVGSVNELLDDLTEHTDEIARVVTAVARGDLTQTIDLGEVGEPLRGDFFQHARAVNGMVAQLSLFGSEVTRVAQEVGIEGQLGAQADVPGVSGTWKELTDSVNLMASNLTSQVREIARVTTAVAQGDLTKTVNIEVKGEIFELKNTINTMVEQLSSFADEVTRVAREVGTEGRLGGQAQVRGVSGVWRELTENVNSMANNLTGQVRNIAEVATAIAAGDLSRKITVEVKGEILELKNTINTMVDQLSSFAAEVTRVAREVGTEGVLGGQAEVAGVSGVWRELTDNVNSMADNLTNQVRNIADVTTAVANGDLSRKITVEVKGEILQLKNTINDMVDSLSSFADEVTRVARLVGTEGTLGVQAEVAGVSGVWRELTDNVNSMADNLTNQVRNIADVTTAVANGDLSRKITVEVKGEIRQLKNTINDMVDSLSSFADEVTRVAREVGTEGVLGGQAQVHDVSGIWKELTDNVNIMARNLTEQVRGIARVVTAVANGDLKHELRLDVRGEIATLVRTINNMLVTLSTFADQVSGVARDVGVEGKLGGQADVPGAAGIWRDLTNNVNELAGNLTRQVRAIGDVATAVTKGDLTQAIDVEAQGEVAFLKDNINQMIRTLAETTRVNEEQDWLKTNLTRFTRMLQGQRDLLSVAEQVLSELAPVVDAQHGALFMSVPSDGTVFLELFATYGYDRRAGLPVRYEIGQSLVGQAAREKRRILIHDVPRDYIRIASALGGGLPSNIVLVPVLFEGEVKGVIELASFHGFTEVQLAFIEQLIESLGIVVATIEATMRTDELLRQSQGMAEELQKQQEELQQTNEQLEEKARQLTAQNEEVEHKNREVELAKQELEEKAEQLARTSKYKSEFLANMSHELRTPLNSLLILSRQLADNPQGNLDEKEIEYATTIHDAGADLLSLINEILDLAKIESGTMAIEVTEVFFRDLHEYVDRSFAQLAQEKGLEFSVELADDLPSSVATDDRRLRQVLRNLISNALKFTDNGYVKVRIEMAQASREEDSGVRPLARMVALSVHDTGIGIPESEHEVIFEAFQQSDGGTSRRYGGTGLGLSISREIASLLGGVIDVVSTPGKGSVFTLLLPLRHQPRLRHSARRADGGAGASWDAGTSSTLPGVADDRMSIHAGDRVLVLAESDEASARLLLDRSRVSGFRGIVAPGGHETIEMLRTMRPDAIVIDVALRDMDGWVLLDWLKHSIDLRHVPAYVVTNGGDPNRAFQAGALAVLERPLETRMIDALLEDWRLGLDRRDRRVLVFGEEPCARLLDVHVGADRVSVTVVDDPSAAVDALERERFDAAILAASAPGGSELARAFLAGESTLRSPLIVYDEHGAFPLLEGGALRNGFPVFRERTPGTMLARASLMLRLGAEEVTDEGRRAIRSLVLRDPSLHGRKVLIVDDDIRNIFAVTAVLEQHAINVVYAENGQEALDRLEEHGDVDAVLMDIMMPEMDGYEAMRRIRRMREWRDLPIIALTAKAMKGDRESCIEAGASEYVTKPVEPDYLVSVLRVQLGRGVRPSVRSLEA